MRISLSVASVAAAFGVASVGLVNLANALAASEGASQSSSDTIQIPITMTEYQISPRHAAIQVGQQVQFAVTNSGAERHRFNVVGFGERWRAENDQPGTTTIVDATFTKPGVYQLYCSTTTEARHRDIGMVGTITVVPEGEEPVLRVPVMVEEFFFEPVGQVVVAGQPTSFELTNRGAVNHNFVIAGHGDEWRSPTIRPGEPVRWNVTIDRPGTYEIFCSFRRGEDLHKDLGLVGALEVLPVSPG